MQITAVISQIRESSDGLSEQIRAADPYLLDNPYDVALLSMRDQCRRRR